MIHLFNQINSYNIWWTSVQISYNNFRELSTKDEEQSSQEFLSMYLSLYNLINLHFLQWAKSSIYTWFSAAFSFSKKPQVHMANLLRLWHQTEPIRTAHKRIILCFALFWFYPVSSDSINCPSTVSAVHRQFRRQCARYCRLSKSFVEVSDQQCPSTVSATVSADTVVEP